MFLHCHCENIGFFQSRPAMQAVYCLLAAVYFCLDPQDRGGGGKNDQQGQRIVALPVQGDP